MAGRLCWLIFSLVTIAAHADAFYEGVEEVVQWHLLSYSVPPGYPGCSQTYYGGANSVVTSDISLITGAEPSDDRVFISTPRFLGPQGYYYTLSTIPKPEHGCPVQVDPPLQAYPSPDWHRDAEDGNAECNCSALVSVSFSRIDKCNRLWVLDCGLTNIRELQRPCPPKLVVFDLQTNEHMRTIVMPEGTWSPSSFFGAIALDEQYGHGKTCDDLRVHIADTTDPGIVTYDARTNSIVRRSTYELYPEPDEALIQMPNGDIFYLMAGPYSLLAAPDLTCECNNNGYPCDNVYLYVQAFSSKRLYRLKIEDMFLPQYDAMKPAPYLPLVPIELVLYKSSQSAIIELNPANNAIVFPTICDGNINCYRPRTNEQSVGLHAPEILEVVIDMVYDTGCLLLASVKMQNYQNGTVCADDINQRLLYAIERDTTYNPGGPIISQPHYNPGGPVIWGTPTSYY